MIAAPFRPLILGRGLSGAFAVAAAAPLCRLTGLTEEPLRARRIGFAVAAVDAMSLAAAVGARRPAAQRRAAVLNAGTDAAGGALLLTLAARRTGSRRIAAALAGGFLLTGAAGWMRAAATVA